MKKHLFTVVMLIVVMTLAVFGFAACNDNNGNDETTALRFTAPEGTPALAIARLVTDNKVIGDYDMGYDIVKASSIAAEMSSAKSDLVIMPVNAGANLIRMGADYKLVSVAIDGSLYLVGRSDEVKTVTKDDLKGKKIACIGQMDTPGLVFRYIMKYFNIAIVGDDADLTSDNAYVQYVADGVAAKTLLAAGNVDYAVVGEPAATAFKAALSCKAQMNLQTAYAEANNNTVSTYPQAGLFVKTSLANNAEFMTDLFAALAASKTWVTGNAADVTAFMKANVYESAVFPAPSIANCNIDAVALTDAKKAEIITFLKTVMPKDSSANAIDWDNTAIF